MAAALVIAFWVGICFGVCCTFAWFVGKDNDG